MCHGWTWRPWRRRTWKLRAPLLFTTSAVLLRASEWLETYLGIPALTVFAPEKRGGQRVLVLGDGDLSYSAALYENKPDLRLVATTLETREELVRRYRLASAHIEALEQAGALVLHQVDATQLVQTLAGEAFPLDGFHRIIFNFPYQVPGGIKDLRRLLGAFLEEARKCLAPDGVIEVALCAGQGGSGVDPSERGWAGCWRVPLLAAKASLALESVVPWFPPVGRRFQYAPVREPGNKDGFESGGGKTFNVEGALLHRLVPCRRAGEEVPSDGLHAQRFAAAGEALLEALGSREVSWQPAAAPVALVGLRSKTYGPRYPHFDDVGVDHGKTHCFQALCVEGREGHLTSAVAALQVHVGDPGDPETLRWVNSGQHDYLEVLVQRPDFTPCFQNETFKLTREDWLILCWFDTQPDGPKVVNFDLEVAAMLHFGVRDRRQLHHPLPPFVCQCLFFHDLRLSELEESPIDPALVMDIVWKVCGEEILLEAFEMEDALIPAGQRHWRLIFASVASALDERMAYASYQAVRRAAAENSMTLS